MRKNEPQILRRAGEQSKGYVRKGRIIDGLIRVTFGENERSDDESLEPGLMLLATEFDTTGQLLDGSPFLFWWDWPKPRALHSASPTSCKDWCCGNRKCCGA